MHPNKQEFLVSPKIVGQLSQHPVSIFLIAPLESQLDSDELGVLVQKVLWHPETILL